ncbi:hypothetical protein ETB55_23555 [Salmonella enterica subsp. enterica serovar Omuna]|nr:hypothetical protein [Salmonella enterica subsp. enterica serovar Omuna]
MNIHPVEQIYKSLTNIVAPYMPVPETVQQRCSCCNRSASQGKIIRSTLFVLNNSHFMFKN